MVPAAVLPIGFHVSRAAAQDAARARIFHVEQAAGERSLDAPADRERVEELCEWHQDGRRRW
jgi:hypothetical protein